MTTPDPALPLTEADDSWRDPGIDHALRNGLPLNGHQRQRILDRLDAGVRLDPDEGLRAALARAIEGGWQPASIDPGLYHNDPVFHAVVYTIQHAALAPPPATEGKGDTYTCPTCHVTLREHAEEGHGRAW